MKAPPQVLWSNHAVERGAERFGDCCSLTFPDEIIQAVACCKQVGDTFSVGQKGVIYACVLATETKVLVKTVYAVDGINQARRTHNRTIRRKMSKRNKDNRTHNKRTHHWLCQNFDD